VKIPKNLNEALLIQKSLKKKLKIVPLKRKIQKIAGFDVSFKEEKNIGIASACVFSFPELEILETKTLKKKIEFPYIPGFFAFREAPFIKDLFFSLKIKPDLLILDAHGTAHPLGFGLASQIGVILKIPTIGCAKNPLYGKYKMPPPKKGSFSYIFDKDNSIIGAVLRTKDNTKPVFVSPGNLIDLDSSIKIVLLLCKKFRIPEPLRIAHHLTKTL